MWFDSFFFRYKESQFPIRSKSKISFTSWIWIEQHVATEFVEYEVARKQWHCKSIFFGNGKRNSSSFSDETAKLYSNHKAGWNCSSDLFGKVFFCFSVLSTKPEAKNRESPSFISLSASIAIGCFSSLARK